MFTVTNSERRTDDVFADADTARRVILSRLYSAARGFEAMAETAYTEHVATGYEAAAKVCSAAAADLRETDPERGWCFAGVPWAITTESVGALR